ncbi:hypothetical protein GG344DRAFT_71104 [Lentinula edodes]|nr:hypothetical protein GG344DRAFT_71104 [Lentinula edodes]
MCLLTVTYDYDTQYISVIIWDQFASAPLKSLRLIALLNIIRKAQERVERVRARKAAAAAKKAAEEKAARAAAARERAAQEARERAICARQQEEEVVERRRLLAEAATARSQRGTSPSEISTSPRRPVVEIR